MWHFWGVLERQGGVGELIITRKRLSINIDAAVPNTHYELCPTNNNSKQCRNNSSKIDVDNKDNLQTLYTNIKISSCMAMTHPQANIASAFATQYCSCLLLFFLWFLLLLSGYHCFGAVRNAVKFPVFYSFSRAYIATEIKRKRKSGLTRAHINRVLCTMTNCGCVCRQYSVYAI